jgi:hypothetical protein
MHLNVKWGHGGASQTTPIYHNDLSTHGGTDRTGRGRDKRKHLNHFLTLSSLGTSPLKEHWKGRTSKVSSQARGTFSQPI